MERPPQSGSLGKASKARLSRPAIHPAASSKDPDARIADLVEIAADE
jgi:hypothetical protein